MRDGRAARLTDTKNTAVTNIIVYHQLAKYDTINSFETYRLGLPNDSFYSRVNSV